MQSLLNPSHLAELAALLLLVVYHTALALLWRKAPERTQRGRANRLRRDWVAEIIASKRDILAVQTMRNWMMSATLLASTSILIGAGLLSGVFSVADVSELSRHLSFVQPQSEFGAHVKLLVLAVLFFAAFYHFSMTLRFYNHAGYMINLPPSYYGDRATEAVAAMVNRGGMHYNQGTRMFLLAAPVSLWLVGPLWLLFAVLVGLVILWRFDFNDGMELDAASPKPERISDHSELTQASGVE